MRNLIAREIVESIENIYSVIDTNTEYRELALQALASIIYDDLLDLQDAYMISRYSDVEIGDMRCNETPYYLESLLGCVVTIPVELIPDVIEKVVNYYGLDSYIEFDNDVIRI
jgi:hypothetical protein